MTAPLEERTGPHHDSTLVLSFLPALGETRRILSYPNAPGYGMTGGWTYVPVLWSRPRHAVGGDGRIYTHTGADYLIEERSHEGTLKRRILGEVDRIAVTDEDLEEGIRRHREWWRAWREEASLEGTELSSDLDPIERAVERDMRWVGKADFRPVLGSMFASRDGSILVQRLDLEDDPWVGAEAREWDVIGPDGRTAGRLTTPGGFRVRAFEWPHIYLTRRTGDRQEVVRFRIDAS